MKLKQPIADLKRNEKFIGIKPKTKKSTIAHFEPWSFMNKLISKLASLSKA